MVPHAGPKDDKWSFAENRSYAHEYSVSTNPTRVRINALAPHRQQLGSKVETLASAYVVYATLRMLVLFGSFTWAMSRDSMKEFPSQRKVGVA